MDHPPANPSSAREMSILPDATLDTVEAILRIMFHRKWSARNVRISTSPSSRTLASFMSMTVPFPSDLQNPEKSCSPSKMAMHRSARRTSMPSDLMTYSYVLMSACLGRKLSSTRAYAVQSTPP